ncbi:hypothetical protein OIE13_10755 [Streptosporangium sp. NBC_01810]|nr:hypothetical protein [Streptosporangium sp. NBC_01810]WSA28299.1 hypothetical protein OIE13_10755 [Streptosporangium sp. NBC_01810]
MRCRGDQLRHFVQGPFDVEEYGCRLDGRHGDLPSTAFFAHIGSDSVAVISSRRENFAMMIDSSEYAEL